MQTLNKEILDEALKQVHENNLEKTDAYKNEGDDGFGEEKVFSEDNILLNEVITKNKEINIKKRPKLSSKEMDESLSDVKMTESKVGFFKRGKRQENYEKRAGYAEEYAGYYDKMVVDSESQANVIMSDYKKEKGNNLFASHERKTPYLALRMKQLKEMGEYDGDVDTAEFMKNMDVYVDDAKLKEEDKTEEGQAALKIRRDKKA